MNPRGGTLVLGLFAWLVLTFSTSFATGPTLLVRDHPINVLIEAMPARAHSGTTAWLHMGIPIPSHSKLSDTSQLVLVGAQSVRFDVVDRWPNGHIKWIQIDAVFKADASGYQRLQLTVGDGAQPRLEATTSSLALQHPKWVGRPQDPEWWNLSAVLDEKLVAESTLKYDHRQNGHAPPVAGSVPKGGDQLYRLLIDFLRREKTAAFSLITFIRQALHSSLDCLENLESHSNALAVTAPSIWKSWRGLQLYSWLMGTEYLRSRLMTWALGPGTTEFGESSVDLNTRHAACALRLDLAQRYGRDSDYEAAWSALAPIAIQARNDAGSGRSLEDGSWAWQGEILEGAELDLWIRSAAALIDWPGIKAARQLKLRKALDGLVDYVLKKTVAKRKDRVRFRMKKGDDATLGPASALIQGFLLSGDAKFLELARGLLNARVDDFKSAVAIPGGREGADLMHLIRFTANYAAWRSVGLKVQEMGKSIHRLKWRVPPGSIELDLRFAPTGETPFFKATPILKLPAPAGDGQTQSLILEGGDFTNSPHFELRAYELPPALRVARTPGPLTTTLVLGPVSTDADSPSEPSPVEPGVPFWAIILGVAAGVAGIALVLKARRA
ncbi:MAG: hypothetical protein V3W41_22815 [Planctomycetota bacterium]